MLYRSSFGSPHQSLRREIDRLFEDALGRGDTGRSWSPSVDVRENEKAIVLEFELPGIRAENVEVTAENNVLTVRGEKREERKEEDEQGRYHLVERSYGEFTRSFQLPSGIDEEGIDAEFENGVLTVRVPKAQEQQPRRIPIAGRQREVSGGGRERPQIGGQARGQEQGQERERAAASGRGSSGGREGGRESARGEMREESKGEARAASGGRGGSGARGESRGEGRSESRGGGRGESERSASGKGSRSR